LSSKPYWQNSWQLQLHDGTVSCYISGREAEERLARGEGRKVKRKARQPYNVIRLNKPVVPSSSEESPACITVTDMHINAGAIEVSRSCLLALREKMAAFRPLAFNIVIVAA